MKFETGYELTNRHTRSENAEQREIFEKLLKSNLDFNTSNNDCEQRHFWHAFPAKFPWELPKLFIENLTQINEKVLDPMAGSCTTLIEASLLNRVAIGFDIDPLSLIIGKAKFQKFSPILAVDMAHLVLKEAKERFDFHKDTLISELKERFDNETLSFLDHWFLKETQLELLALIREIEKLEDEAIKQFMMLIFSGIIITKSGGVTMACDLAHTRPHRVSSKKPNSSFQEFSKRLFKNLQKFKKLPPSKVFLEEANAKDMPLEDESIDLILTSPPYANNAIDYMRAHKFSLVWFGYKITDLKQIRKIYLGSENTSHFQFIDLPDYPDTKVIQLKKINDKKGRALHRYYSEMSEAIKEMYRVLKHGTACVIIVASSVLSGLDVETHLCLAEIGQIHGFELVHIGNRNIDRNKRMLPTSNNKTHSQIETRMHNEYVLGFWKV
jgi:DNA modification methylase